MKTLIAPTEDFIKLERTKLDADATAGSNVSLTLENNNGMANNTFIVVGLEGSEKAEICKINAAVTAGVTVQVLTLLYSHKKGEPITVYRFDKRKFYGCATEGGSYTELTSEGSPKTIEVDDPQGTRLEYTDTVYNYFKSTYYNSSTTDETDIADANAVLGNQTSRYCTIYGIRKMAGFTQNPFIKDDRLEDKRKQAENEIKSAIVQRYVLPLEEVPPLITYIAECLAAGYLHYEEYGQEGDAVKKLGEARAILKSIQNGVQRLLKSDDTELTLVRSANALSGYPDGSEGYGEKVKFKISQKF